MLVILALGNEGKIGNTSVSVVGAALSGNKEATFKIYPENLSHKATP